ncbi:hypothetical protein B0H19DRAFT_1253414 [Mycena capillaripes]|nr:hypothetical protein B0H19DRAFT_1253414 [Mycena capillaripes]
MTAGSANKKPPSFGMRCKLATLYKEAKKNNITLEGTYRMAKCPDERQCAACSAFYRHLDELRFAHRLNDDDDSTDEESEDDSDTDSKSNAGDEFVDILPPGVIPPIGKSALDVVFYLQWMLGYLEVQKYLEELGDDEQLDRGAVEVLQMLNEMVGSHKEDVELAALTRELEMYKLQNKQLNAEKLERGDLQMAGEIDVEIATLTHELGIYKLRVQEADEKNERLNFEYGGTLAAHDQLKQTLVDLQAQHARVVAERDHLQDAVQKLGEAMTEQEQILAGIRCGHECVAAERDSLLQKFEELRAKVAQPERTTSQKRPAEMDMRDGRSLKRLAIADNLSPLPTTLVPPSFSRLKPLNLTEDQLWEHFNQMAMPDPQDDPLLLGQWIQHNELSNFKGIPASGPSWIVNMRTVRGHQRVMSLVPRKVKNSTSDDRHHRARCVMAVTRVLIIPGHYEELVVGENIQIARIFDPHPCAFPADVDALTDSAVAAFLAGHGLAVPDANDTWLFCRNFLLAQSQTQDPGYKVEELCAILARVDAVLQNRPEPPGLRTESEDQYARTVPGKHRLRPSRPPAKFGGDRRRDFNNGFRRYHDTR